MSDHGREIANTVVLVQQTGKVFTEMLCDHQAFFVIVFDEHAGAMPAAEDLVKRPADERKRAADVLRMWAARIETGKTPERGNS